MGKTAVNKLNVGASIIGRTIVDPMLLLIEFGLVLLAVVVALIAPGLGSRSFSAVEGHFSLLARNRRLAVISVGLTALAVRAALLPILPVPQPVYHDDFCYLLAADTFAHGRVTNPTHTMWVHFESFGIMHQPTYQCVAQPAQGLMLAFGTVVLGNPFWGVWISTGLMCATICWMLQAWMPARWALLGGLFAILRFATFGYWANSYWGGALAATGGALLLGAVPRIKRSQRIRDALFLALGLAILANTRPYEGFVLGLTVAVALFAWMLGKNRPPLRISFLRVMLPVVSCMVLVGAAMAYYNWRVTGSPLLMPYQIERKAYFVAPYFVWQSLSPEPIYHHELIRDMYVNRLPQLYNLSRSPAGVLLKFLQIWKFYLGPVLTLPLVLGLLTLRSGFRWRDFTSRTRFLVLVCGISVLGFMVEVFFEAHYAAPITCLIVALVLLSMRQLQSWQVRGLPTGLFLVRAIPAICLLMFALRAAAGPLHLRLPGSTDPAWFEFLPKSKGRPAILAHLQRLPGRQLVFVRYKPDRIPFEEWVYNEADIDDAKVVWAQDMSPEENEKLIRYFADRHAWLVEADEIPPRLTEYVAPMTTQRIGPLNETALSPDIGVSTDSEHTQEHGRK